METVDQLTKMRISRYSKNKDKKEWYKRMLDYLDYRTPFNSTWGNDTYGNNYADYEESRTKRINYNLFNGIIDTKDFEHIYKPLGEDVGELPADFSNKDIISGKLKVLLGMEMERPFAWRVTAVNPEATTRKEKEKFGRMREYVVQQIMAPIQQAVMTKYAGQMQGQEVNPEQQEQIQQQIQAEIQAQTPEEVDYYMKRKHQDPAEIMMSQIMNYIMKEQDVNSKFNKGFKHGTISAEEIYWVGIHNDNPVIENVNPLYFDYDKESDSDFIEDGEWAGVELWLTPSQTVQFFGSELTNDEIDSLYDGYNSGGTEDADWNFDDMSIQQGKVRVLHRAWRGLRKIGFLSFMDMTTGQIEERLVDETYRLNQDMGDINILWEWIPEVYEGYKINRDIYVRMRPVPGQVKNIDNLYDSPLPYYGGIYDNINSKATSLIDRVKLYQYYYNIIMYRVEMLMSSDKGKWVLLNMNMIPNSQGIDMKKWLYYTDALKIGFMNPNEEGNQGTDITNAAKEIDMSLVSDIQKYIDLAEYIEQRCGATIGVTKEMEGRIGQYQTARTTEQAIAQGSYIVEPYFDFHNIIKKNALTGLMNMSVVAYSTNGKDRLDYVLDDFSREIIRIDKEMLAMSYYGMFVGNSMDTVRIKEAITNLGLTAMQNQAIDMSDVIKVLETESVADAKEKLEVGEDRKREQANEMEQQRMEHEKQLEGLRQEENERAHEREKELIILKEKERRETELAKQAILAMGFNENKDMNENQIPDVLEVAREGIKTNLEIRKQDLDEDKFEHQKEVDKEKIKIEKKKAEKQPAKSS